MEQTDFLLYASVNAGATAQIMLNYEIVMPLGSNVSTSTQSTQQTHSVSNFTALCVEKWYVVKRKSFM